MFGYDFKIKNNCLVNPHVVQISILNQLEIRLNVILYESSYSHIEFSF